MPRFSASKMSPPATAPATSGPVWSMSSIGATMPIVTAASRAPAPKAVRMPSMRSAGCQNLAVIAPSGSETALSAPSPIANTSGDIARLRSAEDA